jgi:hypothetical protein
LPPAFHDVADLAHATDIGIADALAIWTAVAVSQKSVTGLLE